LFNRGIDSVRGASDSDVAPGPVTQFAAKYHTPLIVGIAAIAVLVYVQAAHPSGAWTLKLLAVTLIVLLVVELVARPAMGRTSADEVSAGRGA
jgi:membrane protein implicated in regulation of membrane protease activity